MMYSQCVSGGNQMVRDARRPCKDTDAGRGPRVAAKPPREMEGQLYGEGMPLGTMPGQV